MRRLTCLLISFVCLFGNIVFANSSKLLIISPHRKSLQKELIPPFRKWYEAKHKKPIEVEWIDMGGASDDLRYLRARFEKNPKSSGIDILWGGGEHPHLELDQHKLLLPFKLSTHLTKVIPEKIAGIKTRNKTNTWHASAMSSFGLFFNKPLLKLKKLKAPNTWEDLAQKEFFGLVSQSDPRRSSSAVTMNVIILQSYGWVKGWQILTKMAGNTEHFSHSSSDPIRAVTSGQAVVSPVINYYAASKIAEIGPNNLGFVLPKKHTIINSDPISILKGAPNQLEAQEFVSFVLGKTAQRLLILAKGSPFGPKYSTLGRMAVNKEAYAGLKPTDKMISLDPFTLDFKPFALNLDYVVKIQFVLSDLIGAIQIDTQSTLKDAWQHVIKRGMKLSEVKKLTTPPITEKELVTLADKWHDQVFRNKTINSWVEHAKKTYAALSKTK